MSNCNKCDKECNCGCIPQSMTTPDYCIPNTPACPDPSPCTETFDADCVIYTGDPIEGLNGPVIPTNSPISAGLNDIMDYINKRYCDLEAEFTSYPDQRYTDYVTSLSCAAQLSDNTPYCCGDIPAPFDNYIGSTPPCGPGWIGESQWFAYMKALTPSVEVTITGGQSPYTYEWTIAEGDQAGHYFRGCLPTNTNKIYLDVNFKKIDGEFNGAVYNGRPKLTGAYTPKTTLKEDGSTIAGTTLQLKVTDANGANKTFYYRYTNEDCYPVNASVRVIPTCTDLNSYGIYRPELNEGDIGTIYREQRDSFMKRQWGVLLASSAGTGFQPYDKPKPQSYLPGENLNLNSLTFPHDIFYNNNGKAPLKYINVFDGGYPISQIYYEDSGVIKNMWTEVIDPDYGTTLSDRYPGVIDIKRRPAVKTAADLPTLTSNDPIPIEPGQIIRVFDAGADLIWNSTLSIWEPISLYFDDILTTRRARRDAQKQSTVQMSLATKPFTWSNVYILQHVIKTYRDYQITNI